VASRKGEEWRPGAGGGVDIYESMGWQQQQQQQHQMRYFQQGSLIQRYGGVQHADQAVAAYAWAVSGRSPP
jgi:hypothetical protein